MDAAYLLGEVTDLRAIGVGGEVSGCARVYFGEQLLSEQCHRALDLVAGDQGLGYTAGSSGFLQLRRCLGTIFLLNRSPYLEELSEEVIREAGKDHEEIRSISHRVIVGLQQSGCSLPGQRRHWTGPGVLIAAAWPLSALPGARPGMTRRWT